MQFVDWFVDFEVEYFTFGGSGNTYTAQDVAGLFGVAIA